MCSSEANGGPLSVYSMQGSPYWEMSSCRCMDSHWVDLVDTLYKKGYLINRSQMLRYSLPLWVR